MTLPLVHPSLVHMLEAAAEAAPGHEALVCADERMSYADYRACAAGLARELVDAGARGERVAILLGNSLDVCIAMFAAHAAGAQAVPLNPIYTRHELEPILTDAAPCAVIYDDTARAAAEPIAAALGIPHRVHVGAQGRRLTAWRGQTLALPQPFPAPQDIATIQYTSGTTGRAKGAMLTHRAISVNISQREANSPTAKACERILAVMPLFHVYGVAMCLHNAVYCYGTLVIVARFHPQAVIDAMAGEAITLLGGSPTLFTGLLNYPGFAEARFPALRLSYSGGAPLPEQVLRRWEETTGTPIYEGYGQSEAGPVISYTRSDGPRKPGAVGQPLPESQVQIVDVESGTRVLPAGERGEIRVHGPQVMSGYRNLPDETARTLRDGWLYTGDIGEFDSDGFLYIRDRKKDLVIVSGFNVSPREVEEVLYGHPAVREVAVVGVPDDYRGEILKAFVALRDGQTTDTEVLRGYCAEQLAKYKVPALIEFVPELPKTATGKVDKKRLRSP